MLNSLYEAAFGVLYPMTIVLIAGRCGGRGLGRSTSAVTRTPRHLAGLSAASVNGRLGPCVTAGHSRRRQRPIIRIIERSGSGSGTNAREPLAPRLAV